MPTNRYTFTGIDCANCAAKIEAKFNALPEVEQATITFATRQLHLNAADPDALLPELTAVARTVEPDATFASGSHPESHHHHDCTCDHHHECACNHHDHHSGCSCGHDHHEHDHNHAPSGLSSILFGAGLFLLGLIFSAFDISLLSKVVFVAAWLILGREVLTSAAKNLTRGHVLDENFLMSLATVGAFAINEFPEAVGVMLFYRIGEFFEEKAVARSRSQIMEAVDLRPEVDRKSVV